MSDWFETLDGCWRQAWQQLGRGVADRHHPARHPTFATVSAEGWPEARTVVLRRADDVTHVLDAHTDLQSSKIESLRANPRAAFHVWIPKQQLQLRLQCDVAILHGDEVAEDWARVPDPSRQSYGVTPPPGTAISEALDYVKKPDPETFAVLRCALHHLDVVHLGEVHRRARFTKARDWAGEWLAP